MSSAQHALLPTSYLGNRGEPHLLGVRLASSPQQAVRWVTAQLLQIVGLALFFYSVTARSLALVNAPGMYDEGILLSNAHFTLRGLAAYRDFYTNDPPGMFWLIAATWKIFGVSAWSYRMVAVGIHLVLALIAGRLGGRIVGHRFSCLAMGLVSVWTVPLGVSPYAWLVGVSCALLFIELLCRAEEKRERNQFVIAGIAFGLIGCFRLDLLVYLSVVLGGSWLLPKAIRHVASHYRPSLVNLGHIAIGAALPLALLCGTTFVLAGPKAVFRDLVIEQVKYAMPGRVLPIPDLLHADMTTHLPMLFVHDFEAAIALTFLAPVLAVTLIVGRRALSVRSASAIPLLGVLAIACVPQLMGRTDTTHAIFATIPALVLAAALFTAVAASLAPILPVNLVIAACGIGLVVRPIEAYILPRRSFTLEGMRDDPSRRSSQRGGGFLELDAKTATTRQAVLSFLNQHTSTTERVFFGTHTHEWVYVNEADLYFLSDRLPAVRYTQYGPNVASRLEVQEEMVASLEKHAVRYVVLSSLIQRHEGQKELAPGSTRLDNYLHEHFSPIASHGVYTILSRK